MTLDEAINKFRDFAQGKGDFDELDLKEVIVDNRDEAITRAKGTIDLEALIRIAGYHDGVLDSRLATEETLTKLEALYGKDEK
jgi:hypothetical protein